MRLVIIESPYGSTVDGERASPETVDANMQYLNNCIRDSILRDEAPFASHRMYTGALDDNNHADRARGMEAGFTWAACAEAHVVYIDRGITPGMRAGIERARKNGKAVEFRSLHWSMT